MKKPSIERIAHSCCRTLAVFAALCAALAPSPSFAATVYWKSNAGGDVTDASNWNTASDGSGSDVEPAAGDTLDFSKITTTGYSLTGSFGDDRIFAEAKFALTGANYVSLAGSLHFQSLSNANHLAVASTGSLTVEGNLAWHVATAKLNGNVGELLYKNDGTVVVKGVAYGHSGYGRKITPCYQTRAASSAPFRVGGIEYQGGGYTFGYRLSSYGDGDSATASWVVGSQGMFFYSGSSGDNAKNCFVVDRANATLCSQADWSIETSGNSKSVADIYIDGKTLTIDTEDYDDNSVPRTVTLNGRIYSSATTGTGVAVTGNGTFVIATKVTSGKTKTTSINNTLAVSDTATLQINEDADCEIADVTLANGTSLALPYSGSGSFVMRQVASMTLAANSAVNLVIDGPALPKGFYTLLPCVPLRYNRFAVGGTAVSGRFCTLTDDGSSLCLIVGDKVTWKADAGGDITSSGNWTNSVGEAVVPEAYDYLDFSKIATSGCSLTGSFGDDRVFAGATFGLTGNKYVYLTDGSLHVYTLLNANHLTVEEGGVLTVELDLKWDRATAKNESNNMGRLLQGNKGTVTVKGIVVGSGAGANCACYGTRDAPTSPMRVGGIDYYAGGYNYPFYLYAYGSDSGRANSEWIVGGKGMTFSAGGSSSNAKNCFVVDGANATLRSQADWSIETSGNTYSVADIYIDGKTLTIDTKDYDDNSVPRTVTLNGRVYSSSTSGTGLEITGNGTFVLATKVSAGSIKKTRICNTLAVSDTATLQINETADYAITNVALAAGTTLALPNTTADTFVTRTIGSVTLPASGTVNLVIDGAPLSSGDYTILSCVPENYNNFAVSGTAIGDLSTRLVASGSSLTLRLYEKKGLVITFR